MPAGTTPVICEEHPVFFGEIFPQCFDFAVVQANVPLSGHVNHGRAFSLRKSFQLGDETNLRFLRSLVPGIRGVPEQHAEIGISIQVLFPVSTGIT